MSLEEYYAQAKEWARRGVRRKDPDTSHLASYERPENREIDRWRALKIHAQNPSGLTDFELGDEMNRQQTSAGKRRGELRDMGYIRDSATRRPAPSGSSAIVWEITPDGLNLYNALFKEKT